MADDAVGGLDDALRGAVVALQLHHFRTGVLLLEVQDVVDISTTESVNALRVVAHHADIRLGCGEQREDAVLGLVGVLVLVDEDETEAFAVLAAHLFTVAQEEVGVEQDVVEVKCAGGLEPLLVVPVKGGQFGHAVMLITPQHTAVGGILRREDQLVLGFGDAAEHARGLVNLIVQALLFDEGLHQGTRVGGIVNGIIGGEARIRAFHAQHTGKDAVKCAAPQSAHGFFAANAGYALVHLTGGLVGKGQGHDAPRLVALTEQVGYLVSQHARLAGACARHHEERASQVGDGFQLGIVEGCLEYFVVHYHNVGLDGFGVTPCHRKGGVLRTVAY